MKRIVRCECGTEVGSADEDELVALAQDHAWRAHRMHLARHAVLERARAADRTPEPPQGEQG